MRAKTFVRPLLFAVAVLGFWWTTPRLQAQPDTWVTTFGSGLQDAPEDILVDDAGYSYVCGYFRDTMQIGGQTLASAGGNDIYLAKFTPTGQLDWAKRFGWYESEFAHDLAFDNAGNIIMVGEYQDSTMFESTKLITWDTTWNGNFSGDFDVYWMRLSTAGVMDTVWAGGWYGSESWNEVEVGPDDRYYFTGFYRTFNNWTYLDPFDAAGIGGGYDDPIWVRANVHGFMDHKAVVKGRYVDRATSLDLIGDSLVVMAGTFQDTCYFRDSTIYQTAGFDDDVWVSCYNTIGDYRWSVAGGSKGIDHLQALETDATGAIYVAGSFDSLLTLGGQQLVGSGALDGFVAKLDINGAVLWLKKFGGAGFDGVQDLRLTASGEMLVTGYFQGGMLLDGGNDLMLADTTNQNAFVALIDAAGNTQWARSLGGIYPDMGFAVDEDAAGYIYALGTFSGTGEFGQASATSLGAEDTYLVRMNSNGAVSAPDGQTPAIAAVTAWPNPTADRFHINFELQQPADVTLVVMDLNGQVVQSQAIGRQAAGRQSIDCDVHDLASGMYLYRIQANAATFTGKVVVTH